MPTQLSYDGRKSAFAKKLRREMTRQERHLWYDCLRSFPITFRRQKQFGYYIVDFYCAACKLVIEIDGSQHYEPENAAQDQARTEYLNSIGLQVVRFSNHDVDAHFQSVCATIERIVQAAQQKEKDIIRL